MSTPRMRRLPPLNALRSFESAARHESFIKAAIELHVTPGAVSRLVKTLEDSLGVELFTRTHRGVLLTREGKDFADDIGGAFDQVFHATERLQLAKQESGLSICCHPTFAVHWLIPRWLQFQAALPSTQINLKTTLAPELENTDEYDIIVKLGLEGAGETSSGVEVVSERVVDVETFPICSQSFLDKVGGSIDFKQIGDYPLIHAALRPHDWDRWLVSAGFEPLNAPAAQVFESLTLAYNAVISGAGIAIGIRAFLVQDIIDKRLVIASPHIRQSQQGFNIYFNARRAEKSIRIRQIREWMIQERLKEKTDRHDFTESLSVKA